MGSNLQNIASLSSLGAQISGLMMRIYGPSTVSFDNSDQPITFTTLGEEITIYDPMDYSGTEEYTLTITIDQGGTFDLGGTTGLTLDDGGTGAGNMTYSDGTIAEWNTALFGSGVDDLVSETANLTITMTRESDLTFVTKTILVTAVADADFLLMETTGNILLEDGTTNIALEV